MNGRARVLVVDDEQQILRALRTSLRGAGYEVETAETAEAALAAAAMRPPDAVILDLVLPDGTGIDVCRELRKWSSAPVILLSAVGEEREKIAALDAGADDYVTKPVGIDELLARLRAVLRRAAPSGEPVIELGELVVDLEKRAVTIAGEPVHLTPHQFELLRVLAANEGKLLTHRALLREVWGPGYGNESNLLHVNISQLRRKIEPDRASPRYLLTEPGAGYRLVADPAELEPSGFLQAGAPRSSGGLQRRLPTVEARCTTWRHSGSRPRASRSPTSSSGCWTASDDRRRRLRARRLAPRLRLPRLRALPGGAVLSGQGISQIVVYSIVLVALGYPLGIWMARIYTVPRVAGRFFASLERGFCRVVRIDPDREQDWKSYGLTVLVFSILFCDRPLRDPAGPGASVPEPGPHAGRAVAPLAEHGRQLHHQHELAVLRRRVHDVVPDPDGRARGAELRLGRGRDRRARGRRPRARAPLVGDDRQLLGRPLPHARLPPAAARGRRRRCS